MQKHPAITFICLFLISLGYFATDIYLPSLPAIAADLKVDPNKVQLTIFSYLLSYSFTPLIFGPLSDHIGRKKVILTGLLTSLFASLGCLLSININMLIFFRLVQGMGAGCTTIATRAMVADLFKGKALAKQLTYITMLLPLILTCAPIIGGVIQETFNWRAVFLFLTIYIAVITVVTFYIKESLQERSKRKASEQFKIYREILQNRGFIFYGLGFVIPTIGLFAYLTASPFLFQEIIGLSPTEYGFLAIYLGATIMLSSFVNSKLLNVLSINTILFVNTGLMMFSGLLMGFFHYLGILTTSTLLIPAMVYITCLGFGFANSVTQAMTCLKEHIGTGTAVLTSAQFLAGSLGSLAFSLFAEKTALPLALCFFLVGILALIALFSANSVSNK